MNIFLFTRRNWVFRPLARRVYYAFRDTFVPYQAKSYWEKRGQKFVTEPIQTKLFPPHEFLHKFLQDTRPRTLLEVGCGFGRNLRFIREKAVSEGLDVRLVGVDISSSMLESAKEYLEADFPADLMLASAEALPFPDDCFDLVIVYGVLMHTSAKLVPVILQEIKRVSRRHIIVAEEFTPRAEREKRPVKVNQFTFVHPYTALFPAQGLEILRREVLPEIKFDFYILQAKPGLR